ncbi:UNVERIFIED_CONTAM: hypothetical protein RMT77_012296 [Armadillidium vulgare]
MLPRDKVSSSKISIMVRAVFVLLAVCAVASARMAYQFPDGFATILRSAVSESFSCEGLAYGYYADTENNCEIFHVCLPVNDHEGNLIETAHFSFLCPNTTIFNQESLTCASEQDALPCADARSLYESSNSEFGVVLTK